MLALTYLKSEIDESWHLFTFLTFWHLTFGRPRDVMTDCPCHVSISVSVPLIFVSWQLARIIFAPAINSFSWMLALIHSHSLYLLHTTSTLALMLSRSLALLLSHSLARSFSSFPVPLAPIYGFYLRKRWSLSTKVHKCRKLFSLVKRRKSLSWDQTQEILFVFLSLCLPLSLCLSPPSPSLTRLHTLGMSSSIGSRKSSDLSRLAFSRSGFVGRILASRKWRYEPSFDASVTVRPSNDLAGQTGEKRQETRDGRKWTELWKQWSGFLIEKTEVI